jgi:uncharacterized membrane protein YfcA
LRIEEIILDFAFDITSVSLLAGGFVIGIFAVVIGGGMFFSVPFLQFLFPGISAGAIIGNLKIGSVFRSIGSTTSTWREIDFPACVKVSALALTGTVLGTSLIAHLSQE